MIENTFIEGQGRDLIGFNKKLPKKTDRQSSVPDNFLKEQDPTLFVSNDTQVKILTILTQEYPNRLKTLDLSEPLYLHRSTIGININELVDLGLVHKGILESTKNHVNPTSLFKISDVYVDKIRSFLKMKAKTTPELFEEIADGNGQLPLAYDDADDVPKTFEDQVRVLFMKLTQQISSMQEEIDELKARLDEKSYSNTDLSDVMQMVNSLDAKDIRKTEEED